MLTRVLAGWLMAMAQCLSLTSLGPLFRMSKKAELHSPVSSKSLIARKDGELAVVSKHGLATGVCLFAVVATLCCSNALAEISEKDTYNNVPRDIQGSEKAARIQRPISPKAERCTQKCVSTCIAGGAGGPGEGPLNIRRPLVVFKDGFRTRKYCLVECSDICNLLKDRDDGP
ncbi:uncharacterized protein LOC9661898 isoform X2 [Selaginella moellendorffii]|uniref:uncharacterized protein LOC9661898 isoform X2 n=1 Tax=Selaginella moellendorffii TaxID=88036 RepID=UPI000D1CC97A|nr:uncharacterized protein LOC9661898 isoform X2 [Selaginella moellendorffii]|eukprot:XP_024543588.1 uncharacterized protein LOC9661898 isoform X2 [Selaginella moellendorffii]